MNIMLPDQQLQDEIDTALNDIFTKLQKHQDDYLTKRGKFLQLLPLGDDTPADGAKLKKKQQHRAAETFKKSVEDMDKPVDTETGKRPNKVVDDPASTWDDITADLPASLSMNMWIDESVGPDGTS